MKIDHYKSVSPDVLDGAYKLFADANAAYNARGAIDYKDYLEKLPADWRDKYHYILQWCPMWFATLLEINRGREVRGKLISKTISICLLFSGNPGSVNYRLSEV